jgi:hypothetical protein
MDKQIESEKCVHTEHCCVTHGCKYGDPKCPVDTGVKKQSFACEDCVEELEEMNAMNSKEKLAKALSLLGYQSNERPYFRMKLLISIREFAMIGADHELEAEANTLIKSFADHPECQCAVLEKVLSLIGE